MCFFFLDVPNGIAHIFMLRICRLIDILFDRAGTRTSAVT